MHLETDTALGLQRRNHAQQMPSVRIALGAEHPHQALRRCSGGLAQCMEAEGRIDVIAQDRFRRVDIALDQRLDRLLEQRLPEFRIAFDARFDEILEAPGQRHVLISCQGVRCLARLVIRPPRLGGGDVLALPRFAPTGDENDEPRPVLAEIDPISSTPIHLQFRDALAQRLDIRGIAALKTRQDNHQFRLRLPVEIDEPFLEWRPISAIDVNADLDAGYLVSYSLLSWKGTSLNRFAISGKIFNPCEPTDARRRPVYS